MLTVEQISSEERFASLKEEWNDLLSKSYADTVFLTWEWAFSWWKVYGAGKRLFVLTAKDNERLVGIAPFVISRRKFCSLIPYKQIEFLGSEFVSGEYLDFIIHPDYNIDFLSGVVNYLYENQNLWDVICLSDILEHAVNVKYLVESLNGNAIFRVEPRNICPYTLLPETWDGFLEVIPSMLLNTIKRKTRKLNRLYKVEFGFLKNKNRLNYELDAFFDSHQRRWEKDNISGSFGFPRKRSFYLEVAKSFLERDWLRLYTLKAGDRIIAALYGFMYNDTYFYLQAGYDPDWSEYSPGTVLMGYVFRDLICEGCRKFDFLRGVESHKYLWGAVDKKTVTLFTWRSYYIGKMSHLLLLTKRKIKCMTSRVFSKVSKYQ